jgi:8-oxo-dGTP pyrophosphatase MutT (NUDIX family)
MKPKRTISAGGVVLNAKHQVLIVNQRGNSWSLPKGHLDPGEQLLDAARREIHEEAGVNDVELVHYLGSYERYRIGKIGGEDRTEAKELHFFLFTSKQQHLVPVDAEHHPEARWVSPDQVAAMLTHPRDRDFFIRSRPFIYSWSK